MDELLGYLCRSYSSTKKSTTPHQVRECHAGDILPFERLFVNSVDFRSFRTMLAGVAHHHDEAGRCLASNTSIPLARPAPPL